ncbi:hypothetical protein BZZ01_00280 [Nostocales cyanobacterium HT-58-2]|nr:hypothetical protein BZZ01_00280 [Nostocales cyanobacterium HT-58-2]
MLLWGELAGKALTTQPTTYVGFGATNVMHGLFILHSAQYDAWAAYDPVAIGTRLGDTLRRPASEHTVENKNKAISYASYRTLVKVVPFAIPTFNKVMRSLGYDPNDTSLDSKTPTGIGNLAAQAVLDSRLYDGSNMSSSMHSGQYSDYTQYQPVNDYDKINDPDHWQPLRVPDPKRPTHIVDQQFLTPHFGLVVPFALKSGSELRPAQGPKSIVSDPGGFRKQAQQVLDMSANLTDEQKATAEFWASAPWYDVAKFVSHRDKHDVDTDVKMFFLLSGTTLDAQIAAWDTKRTYDSVRPITAIHYLYKGQKIKAWGGPGKGTQIINGEEWQPYLVTPSFPEYISGHSITSSACAEVLKRFTGSDFLGFSYTQKAKSSKVEKGKEPTTDVTLRWNTFSDAAASAGISRLWAGVHFEDGDLVSRDLGRLLGAKVWDKAQSYISPKSVTQQDIRQALSSINER